MKMCLLFMMSLIVNVAIADTTANGFNLDKCTKCHTDFPQDGKNEFPRLEGQPVKYFIKAMTAYQTKARHSTPARTLMSRRVNLDATTIAQIADYFNKLPTRPGITSDAQVIAKGKDIYENGIEERQIDSCVMCHGKKAEGKGSNPRLASQFKFFLMNQLEAYEQGTIEGSETMTTISKALTAEEKDAVASYLQSL